MDTGHLVAFDECMGFNVKAVRGMKSTFFSGAVLVVDVNRPCKVLMQTRGDNAFLSWHIPRLPRRSDS